MSVGVRKGGEAHKAQTGGQRLTDGVYFGELLKKNVFILCTYLHLPVLPNGEEQLLANRTAL